MMNATLKNIIGFIFFVQAIALSAFAQVPEVQREMQQEKKVERQYWRIEYFDKSSIQRPVPITIVNRDSGLKSRVNLQKSPIVENLWKGIFAVRFARGRVSPEMIDFFSTDGKKLINSHEMQGDYLVFQIWPTEDLRKAFESKKGSTIAVAVGPKKLEADRIKQQELEAERQARLLEEVQKLSEAQKKARAERAGALGKEGLSLYDKGSFREAAELFDRASEMDPENLEYVYQHAVSRYKINEYNRSLNLLALSDGADVNPTERYYYTALNHMKLNELDQALKEFSEIKEDKDPQLSPLASFFAGHIEFQRERYPQARQHFQDVLDMSKDKDLDKQSEAMLDQIDAIEAFIAASKEKFRYSLYIGPVYDSNVLGVQPSLIATGVAAWRANYGGSFTYHIVKSMDWSLSGELSFNDYYSLDSGFKTDATLQTADALEGSVGFPIRFGRWDITPSWKSIMLAPSGGARSAALNSAVLGASWGHNLSPQWIAAYRGEYSSDASFSQVSSADDDQSGARTTLGGAFTYLMDLKGERYMTTDVSYALASTKGKNYRSAKPALSFTYGYSGFWNSPASVKVDLSSTGYGEATTTRTDQVIGLNYTQSKKLSDRWSLALVAGASSSQSPVSTYQYSKFSLSSLFTYSESILRK